MPVTMITVTAGSQDWVLPDGTLAQGGCTFQPVQEAAGGGWMVAAAPISLPVVDGDFPTGHNQLASNAEATGLAYLVTENITGAKNPPPYIVTPTGATLDLSTASRAVPGPVSGPFVLASAVGQVGGPAGPLNAQGHIPADQIAGGGAGSGTVTAVNGVEPDGTGNVALVATDLPDVATAVSLAAETDRAQNAEATLATALAGKADAAATTAALATKAAQADLAAETSRAEAAEATKATDTAVVHLAGTETVGGTKTFSTAPVVPDGSFTAAKLASAVQTSLGKADSSEQAANKGAANGYAGLDATSRVAASHSALARQKQTPAFASTVTVDATLGSDVEITLTGNLTLANPTGLIDGQLLQFILIQDATGGRTIAFGTVFNNPGATVTLSTASGKRDRLLCQYHAADTKLDVVAFQPGF